LVLNGYDRYGVFHRANEFERGKSRVNSAAACQVQLTERQELYFAFEKMRVSV
jgi:hypothetical protein